MRSTNVAENGRKCGYMLNFWNPVRQIDVGENDCNRTFRVPLTYHVISRTRSCDVSADKNAITRQCMVISTSNLARIIDVGVDACGILSRSVGRSTPEVEIWRTFSIKSAKINGKRRQIAEILHSNRKSRSANRTAVSKFTAKIHK